MSEPSLKLKKAWSQLGYSDGLADRDGRPVPKELRSVYATARRRGLEARARAVGTPS